MSDDVWIGAIGGMCVTSGLVIGPSLGQFYAGSGGQATLGVVIRILAPLIAFNLLRDHSHNGGQVIFFAAVAPGIIYSFIDTHFAVERANERARAKRSTTSFDLFPTLSRTAKGGIGAGMMARVGF